MEEVWFDVDPYNYHGLVNPHEAHNFYAGRIQAYRQARDEQARRVVEPIPIAQDVLTGEGFRNPEQRSLSRSPALAPQPLRNGLSQVTYRDRVRIHTLATLDLTPQRIGALVHRHRSTVVRVLDQPTTPHVIRTRGSYSMDAATQQQLLEFLVERPNRFKNLEQVLHATGLLISKRTLQCFMREHHLGRFVAREHIEIRQPNRRLRLTYATSRQHWGIEDWMRMQWSDEW